jgi:NADPH-dependent curcumin reductase CurA
MSSYPTESKAWFLKRHIRTGMPKPEDFEIRPLPLTSQGDLKENDFVVKVQYFSIDPYYRGRMTGVVTYIDPFSLDAPIGGAGAGEVVYSKNADFPVGASVSGFFMFQEYVVGNNNRGIKIVPGKVGGAEIPLTKSLGILGTNGFTAYFGLHFVSKIQKGMTCVISGAAGGVGSAAVQLCKAAGCTVIGIAGGTTKCDYVVDTLKADAVVNYKQVDRNDEKYVAKLTVLLKEAIATAQAANGESKEAKTPGKADFFFENVGGPVSEAVYNVLGTFAQVSVCGLISQYNLEGGPQPMQMNSNAFLVRMLTNRWRIQGFVVSDFTPQQYGEAFTALATAYSKGELEAAENVVVGFEHTITAFLDLFTGANLGKQLLQVNAKL